MRRWIHDLKVLEIDPFVSSADYHMAMSWAMIDQIYPDFMVCDPGLVYSHDMIRVSYLFQGIISEFRSDFRFKDNPGAAA